MKEIETRKAWHVVYNEPGGLELLTQSEAASERLAMGWGKDHQQK